MEYELFKSLLKIEEPYTFDYISSLSPKAARKVKNFNEVERYELIFENDAKIKITKRLFELAPAKAPKAYLNY